MGLRKAGDYSKVLATDFDNNSLDSRCKAELHGLSVPVDKICDYKIKNSLLFNKSLTLYVIDDSISFGKWWRIRKVKIEKGILLSRRNFKNTLKSLQIQKEKFDSIGSREKSWFIQY